MIGGLGQFLVLPFFTSKISVEDYGLLATSQILSGVIFGVANLGLPISYERNFFEAKLNGKSHELIYSILTYVWISFFIFGIILYLSIDFFSMNLFNDHGNGLLLFSTYLATGFSGIKNYYLIYFKNGMNSASFLKYSIDDTVLSLLLSVFFVMYLETGVIGLVYGQLTSGAFILTVLTFNFFKLENFKFELRILLDCIRISFPLTPRIFVGILNKSTDKIILGILNSINGVGLLSIANRFSNFSFSFLTALENIYLPLTYKLMHESEDETKGGYMIGKLLTPYIFLSVLFCMVISFFSYEVIWLLTPKSFQFAANLVVILGMYTSTLFFGKIPQLIFKKKSHIITIISSFTIFSSFLITYYLALKFQTIGATIGTFISGAINGILYFYYSQKAYKIYWESFKIYIFYIIFFAVGVVLIILDLFSVVYYYSLSIKLLSFLVFIYLGFKLKIISINSVKKIFYEKV